MELALKVAAKIRDSQRFAVYVVIPMWPEGIPATAALQEILFFQVFFIRSQSFYPFPILTAVVSMTCIFKSESHVG
jgi:phospholipase D1/2